MKLQDLAAIVGGLTKATMLICSLIANYYNNLCIKVYMSNLFFTNDQNISKSNNENSEVNLISKPYVDLENKIKPEKMREMERMVQISMQKNNNLRVFPRKSSNISELINNKLNKTQSQSLKEEQVFKLSKVLCSCLKLKCTSNKEFREAEKIIEKVFSFEEYMKIKLNFLKFKSIFFDNNQLVLFDFLDKLNVNDEERVKYFTSEHHDCLSLREVMTDFMKKKDTRGLNDLDIKLIKNSGSLNLYKL